MSKYIIPDDRCTGCGLCETVCRLQAISMVNDEFGFWYPRVDESSCILCGKCVRECPVYGTFDLKSIFVEPKAYAGYCLDDKVRFNSSSGGIFTLIAESVVSERGGVIYGASYKNDLSVEHIRIANLGELYRLQGSKYVQSKICKEIYTEIETDLKNGRQVLFSGTPCQTAAINSRLGKYKNLLTVDVICHGVPSPKSWREYLNELEKFGAIEAVNMREKSYGWNKFHMVITYRNGKKIDTWFNDNPWGKSFVQNLFLRDSCYSCEFKNRIRNADISLGDFWEAARGIHREFDDGDKGTSVILVNSPKGQEVIKSLINCRLKVIPYEWIPDKTYAVARSSSKNSNREKAFLMLNTGIPFSKVVRKCTKTNISTRIIRKIKRMLGKK